MSFGSMTHSGSHRGFSLLETLIALFLIVMALSVMTQLLHASYRRGATSQRRLSATLCGQQKLEEIRTWASDPNNFDGSWSLYDNQSFSDADFPEMQIQTKQEDVALESPNAIWESAYLPAERRLLPKACKRLTVDCRWSSKPNDHVEMSTLIGAPPLAFRATNPVVVTGSTGPLSPDGTATYTARAYDTTNQEIEGLTFSWFVLPKGGNGVVAAQSRDGREGTIGHWTEDILSGTRVHVPGTCDFAARARLNGRYATGLVEVELQ